MSDGIQGSIQSVNWTVTSNNGFDIAFSGDAPRTDGTPWGFPMFTKQDVDASGIVVPNNYDVLDTRFGIVVTGSESTQTGAITWANSPNDIIGTIMTGDTSGTANITLYALGTADNPFTQSGNYSMTVTMTATADEKLNP